MPPEDEPATRDPALRRHYRGGARDARRSRAPRPAAEPATAVAAGKLGNLRADYRVGRAWSSILVWRHPPMPAATSDRNLLFGILALQMDFIDRTATT